MAATERTDRMLESMSVKLRELSILLRSLDETITDIRCRTMCICDPYRLGACATVAERKKLVTTLDAVNALCTAADEECADDPCLLAVIAASTTRRTPAVDTTRGPSSPHTVAGSPSDLVDSVPSQGVVSEPPLPEANELGEVVQEVPALNPCAVSLAEWVLLSEGPVLMNMISLCCTLPPCLCRAGRCNAAGVVVSAASAPPPPLTDAEQIQMDAVFIQVK
jgi:hypothetical protein